MQKHVQTNDRILACGNRTLHMPERNFSSLKSCLFVSIFCFEHNQNKDYLKTLISQQVLKRQKRRYSLARQFMILLKLP